MYQDSDEDAVDQLIRALRHRDFRVEDLVELLWETARDNPTIRSQWNVTRPQRRWRG